MVKAKIESGLSTGIKNTMISIKENNPIIMKKIPADFVIKIANKLEEREEVFKLAYNCYLDKGFIKPNPKKWYIQNYDIDSETVSLMVKDINNKIAGSLTLVFSECSKLPAERIYYDELNELKKKGEKLVEVSRLVIANEYRNSKEVLLLLINYLLIYSYHIKEYTSIIIEVNPRHKVYYKNLLQFTEIGNEKACPTVQNFPAILLHLPLEVYQKEVVKFHNGINKLNSSRSLYSHFLKPEQEKLVAHYLEKQVKPITEEEKLYFEFSESGMRRAVCVWVSIEKN